MPVNDLFQTIAVCFVGILFGLLLFFANDFGNL